MINEEWCAVVGFEGVYEVSSLGKVRSVDRVVLRKGKPMHRTGQVLRPTFTSDNYPVVRLSRNGKHWPRTVHLLVLEAFVGPRPHPDFDARHLNGDERNCARSNLCWGTKKQNWDDKRKHGTAPVCANHPRAKLSPHEVLKIKASALSQRKLAALFGVNKRTIARIKTGQGWKELVA